MVGSVVWALVILAVVGLVGQGVTRLRRQLAPPPAQEPQPVEFGPVEIGEVGEQWIQVVKVLRDHAVIQRPRDLPREGFPVVVDVPAEEIDGVLRRLARLGVAARRISS